MYIRQLSIADLEQCITVEHAAFPPDEASPRAKIAYRLAVFPEGCLGLFSSEKSPSGSTVTMPPNTTSHDCIPYLPSPPDQGSDTLVALVLSTRTFNNTIKDADMAYHPLSDEGDGAGSLSTSSPKDTTVAAVGHQPRGSTIALHTLAVVPEWQRFGLGSVLVRRFIEHVRGLGKTEGTSQHTATGSDDGPQVAPVAVALITHEWLVKYYERLGFVLAGESEARFADKIWIDLVYSLQGR